VSADDATPESINEELQRIFTRLGPQQQAVARFVLDNIGEIAFLSAGDVGRRTGTHTATVVRLVQRLGFDGYPSFQTRLRRQSPQYPAYLDMADRMAPSGSVEEIVATSFAQACRNLERASGTLDIAAVRGMTQALLGCRRVLILGLGVARPVAVYLASSLRFTGADVHEAGDTISIAQEVALLGPHDVAFAIDYRRYYRETAHFAEAARRRGATVCALTDSATSALAPYAAHLLAVPSDAAATPRTSLAASMVVIEVLLASITAEAREHTETTLGKIDQEYRDARVFIHTGRPDRADGPRTEQ
jgi:DNA-binding MurR/RpiR family transcriptional regulator